MNGTIVTVLRVEPQELQTRLARSHTWVKKDGRHVKLALKLCLDGAYPQVWMQGFKVRDEQYTLLLALESSKTCSNFRCNALFVVRAFASAWFVRVQPWGALRSAANQIDRRGSVFKIESIASAN